MDDFERLFALAALVSDPSTAKKNADTLLEIKREREANSKAFKELKAEQIAFNKEKQGLAEGWKSISDAKSALRNEKTDIEKERKGMLEMKASALLDMKKVRQEIANSESDHKKRLNEMAAEIRKLEADVTSAKERKVKAEGELDKIRGLVSA